MIAIVSLHLSRTACVPGLAVSGDVVGGSRRHLTVGLVVALDAKVGVLQVDSEIRQDQLSFRNPQMIRVITSPSSWTIGVVTLIFATILLMSQREAAGPSGLPIAADIGARPG